MKLKQILPLFLLLSLTTCKALLNKTQLNTVKDLSQNKLTNYFLATIDYKKMLHYELYDRGIFVTIYTIYDTKATPENYFEGYDAVLNSVLISVSPDGDYYTSSKLYKIEGIYDPKILEIKETLSPNFSIKIEHGFINNRKIDTYDFIQFF